VSGHVFVSYSRSDRVYVDLLAAHLTQQGIPVWYDHALGAGDRWDKIIRDQIDTCAAFVVIMTPDADESDWVAREINQAEHQQKPIFPLLLQGDRFFRLSNLQFEDVTGGLLPRDRYIARLHEATARTVRTT
jgi:hypothetical protein